MFNFYGGRGGGGVLCHVVGLRDWDTRVVVGRAEFCGVLFLFFGFFSGRGGSIGVAREGAEIVNYEVL